MPKTPAGLGKLYKLPGSSNFYFRYQRRHVSTRTRKRAEAERFRAAYIGKRVAEPANRGPENVTVADLLGAVHAKYEMEGLRSLKSLEARLRLHLLPALDHLRAVEFTTDHRTRYIRRRRNEGASDSTINRELETLRHAFILGAEAYPPKVLKVPKIRLIPGADNPREGFLEPKDYERLRDALEQPVRLMFIIGYHIGWRAGKILDLTWDQVQLDKRIILPPPREASNKWVGPAPIYGDLRVALTAAAERRDEFPNCPWVLHRVGQKVVNYKQAWAKGIKAANLPGLLFHDLRRTAVRNMLDAGIDQGRIMRIIGHRSLSIFLRYRIVSVSDVQRTAEQLEKAR